MTLKIRSTALISACFLAASVAVPMSVAAETPALIRAAEVPTILKTTPHQDAEIVPGEVIVKYKDGLVKKGLSANSIDPYALPGVEKLTLNAGEDVFSKIEDLQADPNVEYAQPVYVYHALGIDSTVSASGKTVTASVYSSDDPLNPSQWGLYAVHSDEAWAEVPVSERQEIVVAIVDTGVRTDHEDLKDNLYKVNGQIVGYNFVQDGKPANDFNDYSGHGTHVAGIIGATANNGKGVAGIASGVKIMPVRVLNDTGSGKTTYVAAGIRFAADHRADVINLSLGTEGYDRVLEEAVNYAIDKGVVVVAATGNESNHYNYPDPRDLDGIGHANDPVSDVSVSYPAALPQVIAVGAADWVDSDGNSVINHNELYLADFSNTGSAVDFIAPGVDIWSTYNRSANDYEFASGTSMATPFVTGLAALILAHDDYVNGLSGKSRSLEVQWILADSAYPLGAWDKVGSGIILSGEAVTMPRIYIRPLERNNGDTTITMDIRDGKGVTVTDSVYSLNLYVYRIETGHQVTLHQDNLTKDGSTGQFAKTYSDMTDPGMYILLADDGGNANELIFGSLSFTILPTAPTASLKSGTYYGSQKVTLTTASPGAEIHYTLDGTYPWYGSTLYTGPITISGSTTLKAVAYQNNLQSDVSTYSYTITTGVGGGGGGGFFGGGFAPTTPTDTKKMSTDPDGKTKLTVTADPNEVLKDIDSASEVVIDASSDQDTDKLAVELSGDILQKAAERGKPIRIQSNGVAFAIAPGSVKVSGTSAAVNLTAEKLDSGMTGLPPSRQLVSRVYDFQMSVGGNRVTRFDAPITITFNHLSSVTDREKLGVYYFNEQTKTWDYVGGSAKGSDSIAFAATHFSAYAVMESNLTFGDIQNHWARHDIEVMAARQVAQGRGPDTFDPNGTVSRAEFAALLTRALSVGNDAQAPFTDVPEGAWYHDAVNKAFAAGIIKGTSDTTFSPNAPITREALATMLLNAYAYSAKVDLSTLVTTQEVKYADEGSVSSWARRNVRLAHALGLMVGNDDRFNPKANATRAEAVSILKRLTDKLNK
ncbi:S8 family serine peptidase [Cohnella caldifontis]|uniref:S8 family serine peptidase n=1 Tax=Cohnella caldifontis TaxID=3027471 RepID=UPI0023EE27CE|nr:S8 family serine peptidase [Cohnella sp. YIM B05605]